MEYLIYPCKTMNISQGYQGSYSHTPNFTGKPCDYPWDEAGSDSGRDWFYAPCGVRIVRIAGVNASATNTIWLESLDNVEMPCGKDYITMMIVHPEDDDLSKLKTGQIFKQGEPIFREGKDGKASGNHFHLSTGTGKVIGNGWLCNSKGAWVLKTNGRCLKPEEAFFISKETKVIGTKGLTFLTLNENEEEEMRYNKVIDLPNNLQKDAQGLIDCGALKGDTNGNLDITVDMIRTIIISKRYADIKSVGK